MTTNRFGFKYHSDGGNCWLRLLGFQFGYHANGRFRLLSERRGIAPPWPTLRVGRTAEISATRFPAEPRGSGS